MSVLGFISKASETVDQLAIGIGELSHLTVEGLEMGVDYVTGHQTPQWIKYDVTGATNNLLAASEFTDSLLALDAEAWGAVGQELGKIGTDFVTAVKTGDDYALGGYAFDVATLVGPASVSKLKYVDEASALTKLAETSEVASTVGKVEDGVKVGQSTYEIIQQKLIEHNITEAEFNRLRATRVVDMTQAEYDMMIDIRNAVPNPTSQTVMQKIIPIEEADNYFGENAWGIRGYITKREDVTSITNIEEAVKGLRLDYDGSKFVDANGNIITDGYVRIEFQTKDTGYIDIPFGEQNGIGLDPDPATGHGFIKSEEYLTPEYKTVKPDNKGLLLKNGAKMFLKMLLVILEVNTVQSQGKTFTHDSILDYHFTSVLLKAIGKLVKELQVHSGVQLLGIRRPIFINQNYFGQIINVPDDQLLDSYDKRLGLTQQINAYFSEQQVFKIEQNNDEFILPVNYLNSEALTVLPATPELTIQHQQQYQGKKMLTPRLFIMDAKGKKLADIGYEEFLASLTDGIFMVDAKSVAVKPLSKEKLRNLQ